jgi:hypothetical protein
MTTPSEDLTKFLSHLDDFESLGRTDGCDAMAYTIASSGTRGEPLLLGRDPVSRYLCRVLPADHRVRCTVDECTVEKGPTHSPRTVAQWSLAAYPYTQALLSLVEDLHYPELWELKTDV